MDERPFRRVDAFDGSEGNWKEWCFNFLVAVGEADKTGFMKEALEIVEKINHQGRGMIAKV